MRSARPVWLLGLAVLVAAGSPGCQPSDAYIVVPGDKPAAAAAAGPLAERLPVDEKLSLTGLSAPADLVRDAYGAPHIFARTLADATLVEGYAMARDRGLQMELLRRLAQGRCAEALASTDPSFIDKDIVMRTLGLHRVAAEQYEAMDPSGEARAALDAFSAGVSQFYQKVRDGSQPLPLAWSGARREWFVPWTGLDSLAILKLYELAASLRIDQERELTLLLGNARALFTEQSEEPAMARRARALPDLVRFAPATVSTVFEGFPVAASAPASGTSPRSGEVPSAEVLLGLAGTMQSLRSVLDVVGGSGSSAFAVGAARSASGAAMLAADPQHSLTSPSALWFVHLEVMPAAGSNEPAVRVAGAAWPGVPGVVTGFNDGLAWAMASSMSDEADLYAEVPGDDGGSVRFEGAQVGLQHVQEPIAIQGAAPMELDVALVPHHGPVLPVIEEHAVTQPEAGAAMVSVRWSGFRARGELEALLGLMRATDVAQGRAALASWGSGARHFVLADAKGSVAAVAQPVPARSRQAYLWDSDRMRGRLPCMLLPGSGAAEWTGMLDAGSMPSMHNPSRGWVAAAAADAVGLTLDNDPSNDTLPDGSPVYLSCSYDPGFRQTRIAERLRAAGPLELEKLAALQADVRSPLGERLTRHLRGSIARALEEKAYPGTHPGLSSVVGSARFASADLAGVAAVLDDWASLGFEARMGVRLSDGVPSEQGEDARASKGALLFNAWLTRVMQLSLGDEAGRLGFEQGLPGELGIRALLHLFEGKPGELASWDAEVGDSILWDDLLTEPLEGRDDRVVTALLDAVEWLAGVLGNNRDDWRWGVLHTVRMGPLVPGVGGEAVPPEGDKIFAAGFPRPGDLFALDGCSYDWRKSSLAEVSFSYKAGASMRFAVELTAQGPRARVAHSGEVMAGVGGAVYGEEVGYWRSNLQHEVPFGIDAVLSSSRSRAAVSVK